MIGLAVAVTLARGGASVTVVELGERCGRGASGAAAGMLAEGAEVKEAGPFLELCRSSRALWTSWADELLATTGVDCELEATGLVRVTTSEDGLPGLLRQRGWQLNHGFDVSPLLDRAQLAQLVPGLGTAAQAGLYYPGDGHVHSHRVIDALVAAAALLGVLIETGLEVTAIEPRPSGARLSLGGGRVLDADYVVVCAGSWSGRLLGTRSSDGQAVEPVRGQVVALEPGRLLLPRIVFGDRGYLLQKRSGLVLVGSTEERVGFQPWPTAAGVAELTAAAAELMPELAQARFASAWAGLRPHSAGGRPLLGRLEAKGQILVATGHHRNGVLLAPITGQLIARSIFEGADPKELAAFSPEGLAQVAAQGRRRPGWRL